MFHYFFWHNALTQQRRATITQEGIYFADCTAEKQFINEEYIYFDDIKEIVLETFFISKNKSLHTNYQCKIFLVKSSTNVIIPCIDEQYYQKEYATFIRLLHHNSSNYSHIQYSYYDETLDKERGAIWYDGLILSVLIGIVCWAIIPNQIVRAVITAMFVLYIMLLFLRHRPVKEILSCKGTYISSKIPSSLLPY